MEVKCCSRCKQEKPLSEFFRRSLSGGYQPYCKPCKYEVQRQWRSTPAGQAAKERRRGAGEHRPQHLRRKYGMTEVDYQKMVESVGGKCQICHQPPSGKPLYVDHCHTTGVVRGLLCQLCNQMLGYARDNLTTLRNAISYLERQVHTERSSA